MAAPTTAQQLAAIEYLLTNSSNPTVLAGITPGVNLAAVAQAIQTAIKSTATAVAYLTKVLTYQAAQLTTLISQNQALVNTLTAQKAAITPH